MNWQKPILTDSGGYQVFSLSELRKLKQMELNLGLILMVQNIFLLLKKLLDIQRSIGSDIMMVLDECTPYPCEYDYAANSAKLNIMLGQF